MQSEKLVYIIDDDAGMRKSIAMVLRSMSIESRSFESAEAFLAHLDKTDLGCVLLDLRMPRMNGMELLHHLGEAALALSVIVMSGHAEQATVDRAMMLGATAFIFKPFDPHTLLETVRAAIAARAHGRGEHERSRPINPM